MKRTRIRLSKKERAAMKLAKEQEKIRKIAAEYDVHKEKQDWTPRAPGFVRPMPRMSDFDAGPPCGPSLPPLGIRKKIYRLFLVLNFENPFAPRKAAPKPPSVAPAKPAVVIPPHPTSAACFPEVSARRRTGTPKAVVISAAGTRKAACGRTRKEAPQARAARAEKPRPRHSRFLPWRGFSLRSRDLPSPIRSRAVPSPEIPRFRRQRFLPTRAVPENASAAVRARTRSSDLWRSFRLQNLVLRFGASLLTAPFDIEAGERVCLVGRNGEGKEHALKGPLR